MRICVIGAGFSGLAAAEAVQRAGHEVVVLEARDRVGGRVWSQALPNGAVIERGAEFVEHYQTEIIATVARLGLRLAPMGMAYADREPRGGQGVDRATMLAATARIRAVLAAGEADPNKAVTTFVDGLGLDPGAREAIVARLTITSTHPAASLPVAVLGDGSSLLNSDESFRVAGGNQGVAHELARRLGPAVHLSTAVQAITWSDDHVTVRASGLDVAADRAVLAVPARLMGRIACDPPLPAWKQAALAGVAYGHAAKLAVPLREATGPSATLSVPDHFWTWTAKGADGAVAPVANCFAGSAPALAELGVTAGPGRWLDRLAWLRPDLALAPEGAVLTTWDDDPWIGASYSAALTGHPRQPAELIRAVGPLHFAGEHTAGVHYATMDGALRSGRRAAEEIMAIRQA
ncbi:MAG: FAD-dependent oxidoreductase [Chloroflexia bacterium]|nr:FAD-dependent oxidoreductase [Chloroflexia bacterium]